MKVSSLTEIPQVREYLTRIGAEARSLKTAVVREIHGTYWKDLAVIRFSKSGAIECSSLEHAPTDLEQMAIQNVWGNYEWPELKPLYSLQMDRAPETVRNAEPKDLFLFRNTDNQIIFVQVRVDKKGEKAYLPFTYWSDDIWRPCEPDGPLPIYNAEKIKDAYAVFIHEGAKAARRVQWMVDGETAEARQALADHPWGRELSGAVHVGWVGGALSPYRTDWSVLKRSGVKRAYIVADNDTPGREAVPAISRQLHIPTFMIQFTDEFPASFDLADKFPASLYGTADGASFYVGPSFRDCLHPATWATDLVKADKDAGRPKAILRDSFKDLWAYIEEADMFVCTEMPDIIRSEQILNKMLSPFSHVQETSKLILKAYKGRSTRVCYRPDHEGLMVTYRGSSAINLHVPTTIRSAVGDPRPFIEFLEYMFVNADERKEAERWVATLIARPGTRMGYGMLLISERQGVGKTTLGAQILAPLVGINNVGFPGEGDVTAAFNDWVANKRLAIVSEIYSGSSWKAYHALKSVITDKDITVNQKYMRQYVIENWCHVLASSNSMRALKMENDDRRWFYPEVTEVPWPKKKFEEFRRWLANGGLSIIKHWAETYGDYVEPSERAPMTERKREMIEGSRSEAQSAAVAIAELMKDLGKPAALLMKDVLLWCRHSVQGRVYDSDYELRKAMTDAGLTAYPKRVKVNGWLQYVVLNDELRDLIQRSENEMEEIRKHIIKCTDLSETTM